MWKQYQKGLYGVENDHTGLSLVSMEYLIKIVLFGRREQVILKYKISMADIKEAVLLQPHIGYIDMRKGYQNGWYSVEDIL